MEDKIVLEQIKKFSPSFSSDLQSLISQIGNNYKPITDEEIHEMLSSKNYFLFVARNLGTNKIVGMITLLIYRIPYSKKGILEDLVVDAEFRRQGIGTMLIQKAISKAREEGAYYLDFTSGPNRESANNLYKKLGFTKRDTNMYHVKLK